MGEKMTLNDVRLQMAQACSIGTAVPARFVADWLLAVNAHLTQPAQAVDDDTLLDIARRVGLRQQFTGVNAEDAKFLLRAFVDALPNANGKEGV